MHILLAVILSGLPSFGVWNTLFGMSATFTQNKCPGIRVLLMSNECGPNAVLRVDFADGSSAAQARYKWAVRAGEIETGQGTNSIKVKNIETRGEVSGEVEVSGYGEDCNVREKFVFACCINGAPPLP